MRHTRDQVIKRTIREYRQLDRVVSKLTPADWRRRVPRPEGKDPWTVKDSLAHITYWKANTIRVLRKEPRPPEQRGLGIVDENRLIYLRWRRRSAKDMLEWHRQVQRDLLAALRATPAEWFSGKSHSGAKWPYDLDGHSADHRIRDIEAALARHKD